jgi:hypothetical protein
MTDDAEKEPIQLALDVQHHVCAHTLSSATAATATVATVANAPG